MKIGQKVRTKVEWTGVPAGTEGYVIEKYDINSYIIGWDLPEQGQPFPKHLSFEKIANMPAVNPECPLRDGFTPDELKYLDLI